jgi:hypothetical protein
LPLMSIFALLPLRLLRNLIAPKEPKWRGIDFDNEQE